MVDLLILTSCINPPKQEYLKLIDTRERYLQTIDSIKFYIDSKVFRNIVICDGSNYKIETDIINYGFKKNVKLEFLCFQQDFSKVKEYGKGYGEGEIMRHIIYNSVLYKQSNNFIKITGRLKILNIKDIVPKLDTDKNYFNFFPSKKLGCLDTRFFMIRKQIYEEVLSKSYMRVNDRANYSYEFSFTDDMRLHKIKPTYFPEVPIFYGHSGTTNTPYIKDNYYYLERYLTKYKLMNSKFASVSLFLLLIYNKIKKSFKRIFIK